MHQVYSMLPAIVMVGLFLKHVHKAFPTPDVLCSIQVLRYCKRSEIAKKVMC